MLRISKSLVGWPKKNTKEQKLTIKELSIKYSEATIIPLQK